MSRFVTAGISPNPSASPTSAAFGSTGMETDLGVSPPPVRSPADDEALSARFDGKRMLIRSLSFSEP